MREKALVNVIGEEGSEWSKTPNKGIENLEKSVQSMQGVINTVLTLQALTIESDVPVGSVLNQTEQARHNCVQTITSHLLVNEDQKTLAAGQDPTIHDIGVGGLGLGVKHEVDIGGLLQESNLTLEELVTVPQRQENLADDLLDTPLLETEGLGTNNGGVDQVKTQSVRAVAVHNE
jgi:hypothetical protein